MQEQSAERALIGMTRSSRRSPAAHDTPRARDPNGRGDAHAQRPGKARLVAFCGLVAALLVAASAAALLIRGGDSKATPPAAISGARTTTVQRRDLVETDIETGTLGYCGSLNVYGRLAGTVTWLPLTGAVVYPDHSLYAVEGQGVYLFDGVEPVRRAFRSGMSDGADVGQLNRDLRAMGYDPSRELALDDHFSEATRAAVERWQHAHGLEKTGEIAFGRIVFQPGPRRIERLYLGLGGSATPQATAGASQTQAEPSSAPGVALVTTSLRRVVTVALEASKQSEARHGEPVQVTLSSTQVVPGHIAAVAAAASMATPGGSSSSGGSTPAIVTVEITLDKPVAGAALDQAPVSVEFAAQRQRDVLSIPVTALVATANGGYAVEEVIATKRTLVPVSPGIYAGGYVAIKGVPAGTVVTNASQ